MAGRTFQQWGRQTMLESYREPVDGTVAGDDASPRTLVHAYESVLQAARRLPPIVIVPSTHRRRGFRRYVHSLPRPTLLLHFFLVDHMRVSLDRVRRRMLAVSALRDNGEDDEAHRNVATQYSESLPVHRWTLYSVSLALVTIVITRFVLIQIPGALVAFGGVPEQRGMTDRLLSTFIEASQSLASLQALLGEVQQAPLETTALVLTSVATVLYVELRVLVPAFRLRRTLFNLHPREDLVAETPARWCMQRAIGLYDLERSVARRLDTRPPREVPFDLIVSALLMPSLIFLGVLFVQEGLRGMYDLGPDPWLQSFVLASAIFAGVMARLAWLARAWVRRLRSGADPYLPSEVLVRGTGLIVAVRDPGTIFWFTTVATLFCVGIAAVRSPTSDLATTATGGVIAFLVLAFVVGPVWFRLNRDVSAYLAARAAPRPGRPTLSLLAMVIGGLIAGTPPLFVITAACVLGSVFNTARRMQRATQLADAKVELLSPAVLTPGFVAFPLVLAHLQRAFNAVCASDGEVVDGPMVLTTHGGTD